MRRSLHYGLRACQLDVGVEALRETAIAIAGEHVPEVAETQRLIHLGERTACDIEVERVGLILGQAEGKRIIALPARQNFCESAKIR